MVRQRENHVLILDNATTCAMRIKTLLEIHGAEPRIVHWNDWDESKDFYQYYSPCLIIVEQTVPGFVVEAVVDCLPLAPLFLLFSGSEIRQWNINKEVNPLSMSLSNYEIVLMLEPYWGEEKNIHLPKVLLLDSDPASSFTVNQLLTTTNIEVVSKTEVTEVVRGEFDMVVANISGQEQRLDELTTLKRQDPLLGVILYGRAEDFSGFDFLRRANLLGVDDIVELSTIKEQFLSRFHYVWRKVAEFKDDQLVLADLQSNMDQLLEQSLVFRVVFNSAIDGVVAFAIDGSIRRVNRSYADMLGSKADELLDTSFFSQFIRPSRLQLIEALREDHLVQQQVMELKLKNHHDVQIPVSVGINRINIQGEYLFVAVVRNVTSQHFQEKFLVQKNEQLQHQLMESQRKQNVVNEMVRQGQRIRLTFCEKLAQMQLNRQELNAERRQRLQNVKTLMQIESFNHPVNPTVFSLFEVIEEVLAGVRDFARTNAVSLLFEKGAGDITLSLDRAHIFKVFELIVDNAIRYNLPRGEVRIFSTLEPDGLYIHISDTGMGVMDHKHQQVFDLYQANICNNDELATGLPLAQALAKLNNIELSCCNNTRSGKVVGSQFTLFLAEFQLN